MQFKFYPKGTCSHEMIFDIEDDIIVDAQIIGGCPGNTTGVTTLIKGMNINDVIAKLEGIQCGMRGTSCPDQLSKALLQYQHLNNDMG